MDSNKEHLDNLSEIRSLMERSSSFLSLSGLSGVCAGILGIISAVIMKLKFASQVNYQDYVFLNSAQRVELLTFGIILMLATLILTFTFVIFFTVRKAKKNNLPIWDSSAKNLLINLFIPLVTGGLFCILLVYHAYDWLVLPSMLVFYGLALINAGKYTLDEIRWLGLTEIFLGLLAAAFFSMTIWLWGIGFGVMNIIYGLVMYFRHER